MVPQFARHAEGAWSLPTELLLLGDIVCQVDGLHAALDNQLWRFEPRRDVGNLGEGIGPREIR